MSEVCKIYHTKSGKVITLDKLKLNSYKFKNDNGIKFTIAGNQAIAKYDDMLRVYTKPNVNDYHYEVCKASNARYNIATAKHMQRSKFVKRDRVILDHDKILDNMLELVAKI